MLDGTKAISLGVDIFRLEPWADVQLVDLRPADYLICGLEATAPLRRLETLEQRGSQMSLEDLFFRKTFITTILDRVPDPTFLPKLAIAVEGPVFLDLRTFCYTRPVAYYSKLDTDSRSIDAEIFPALYLPPHVKCGLTLQQLASCSYLYLSAVDIGLFARETAATFSLPGLKDLLLTVRFGNKAVYSEIALLHNTLPWVKDLISASGCFHLEHLRIRFHLPLVDQPSSAQQAAAIELQPSGAFVFRPPKLAVQAGAWSD